MRVFTILRAAASHAALAVAAAITVGLTPALGVLLLPGVALAAEDREPEVLTLDVAVSMALERNLGLEAAREDYESAKWSLRSARASLFPSIGLSSTARRVDPDTYRRANASLDYIEQFGVDIDPFLYETTYETSFYLTVPIWNGGRLWGGVGAAGGGRDAAGYAYESKRRAVIVDAESAYFDLLRAQDLVDVQTRAVYAASDNANAAARRFEVGLTNRAEALRWEAQRATEERKLVEAEGALTLARTRLLNVLGLPLDASLLLADVPEDLLDAAVDRYDSEVGKAYLTEERALELLAGSPDLLTMDAATRASKSGVTIARGAFLPALNASASYGWKADDDIQPDDETAWSVTLALDVPVFTSFKNLSDYQSSKRAYFASLRRQEDGERNLVAVLRAADSTVRSSLKRVAAARVEEERAAELLKNVRNTYAQGMATNAELVDAEVLYGLSRLSAVDALYDCLISLAEAERLIGPPAKKETGE